METLSSNRTVIWSAALREMADYPLSFITGLGWEAYYQTIGHRSATHSVYLDRLYNLGFIGLALFLLSFAGAIAIARRGLRNARKEVAPFLMATVIGMTSFMIAMAFSDIHGAAIFIWALTGLALRLAVSSPADEPQYSAAQRTVSPMSRDHTYPTTRPTSATPKR
jgi:O-antigen ligase